jgi:hypothetical protein
LAANQTLSIHVQKYFDVNHRKMAYSQTAHNDKDPKLFFLLDHTPYQESIISKSPSILMDPLLLIINFVLPIELFIYFNFKGCKIYVHHFVFSYIFLLLKPNLNSIYNLIGIIFSNHRY